MDIEARQLSDSNSGLHEKLELLEQEQQVMRIELEKTRTRETQLGVDIKTLESELKAWKVHQRIEKLLLLFKELSKRSDPQRNQIAHAEEMMKVYSKLKPPRQLFFLKSIKKYLDGLDLNDKEMHIVDMVFSTDVKLDNNYRQSVVEELQQMIESFKQ